MFRCRVQAEPGRFLKAASVWMQQQSVAILTPPYEVGEDYLMCELTIGDAFSCLTEQEWLVAIEQFKHFMAAEGVN